jgi:subtilase family serine protease
MKTTAFRTVAIFSLAALFNGLTAAQPPAASQGAADGDPQPHSHVRQDGAQRAATTGPTGLVPAQIQQAYGFGQLYNSVNGAGQTIAIIDAFGDRYAT